jgi:hypothetical protein
MVWKAGLGILLDFDSDIWCRPVLAKQCALGVAGEWCRRWRCHFRGIIVYDCKKTMSGKRNKPGPNAATQSKMQTAHHVVHPVWISMREEREERGEEEEEKLELENTTGNQTTKDVANPGSQTTNTKVNANIPSREG